MATTSETASAAVTTPVKRTTFSASAEAGPSRARTAVASPAYVSGKSSIKKLSGFTAGQSLTLCLQSSRRHSLYGIEDRIVIDPGSRIWKVGFSGEPNPRAVFWAQDDPDTTGAEMWEPDLGRVQGVRGDREEGNRLVGVRLLKRLKETFVKQLMTDPQARKVIVIENAFLPTFVKAHIARVLFDILRVPSISFTPSSLLALAAGGRVTGLVVDCGWLETTITPVYYSRPLYHLAHTARCAGRTIHSRLRSLLHHYGTYITPPSSLGSINDRRPMSPVPLSILTDRVIERVLTQGAFVGGIVQGEGGDTVMDDDDPSSQETESEDTRIMRSLYRRFAGSSKATDLSVNVPPQPGVSRGLGFVTLIVPGWIRERAAEVFFEDSDFGEGFGLPDAILGCLIKLPVDLRVPLASSILVVGGTASLPGFIPRLRSSLLHLLQPSPTTIPEITARLKTPAARQAETKAWRRRHSEPYRALHGLAGKVAILNDPAPLDGDDNSAGGKAPKWVPSLVSWVGGSLAGALKTGGPELLREDYDALCADSLARAEGHRNALDEAEAEIAALVGLDVDELLPGMAVDGFGGKRKRGYHEGPRLGDWSRGAVVAG